MLRTPKARRLNLAVIAATLTCGVCLAAGPSWAQEPADTFYVNYFSKANTTARDQVVRITNPGAFAPFYPPSSLCAMVYVFDNFQELKECCGCLISPDGLLELRVNEDLTANPFNNVKPVDGDIKIVSAPVNDFFGGVECDPTGGGKFPNGSFVLNITPVPNLRAWSTHTQGDGSTTEDEFQQATLSSQELFGLEEQCFGIANVGSGAGICKGTANTSSVCN